MHLCRFGKKSAPCSNQLFATGQICRPAAKSAIHTSGANALRIAAKQNTGNVGVVKARQNHFLGRTLQQLLNLAVHGFQQVASEDQVALGIRRIERFELL
jgi:hypothetical protein